LLDRDRRDLVTFRHRHAREFSPRRGSDQTIDSIVDGAINQLAQGRFVDR
jgi:hypothetical protein